MILPAGVHQVALTLQTQNGRKMITSGENLEWDNTIITGLNPIDDNGLWRIVLAEPTGKQATGYIEYTDGERHTSRVNITCTRSYGDEVTGEVIKQDSDEYAEISDNLVTRFPWDGKIYYLGTAEYQKNLGDVGPFGQDERGVIREDGTSLPRAFLSTSRMIINCARMSVRRSKMPVTFSNWSFCRPTTAANTIRSRFLWNWTALIQILRDL